MIELKNDRLLVSFPELHPKARLTIEFQRTLRIPDDDGTYPLPPGLGRFPLQHVDDHASRVPDAWRRRGGVLLPMYQSEALWLNFSSPYEYPFATRGPTAWRSVRRTTCRCPHNRGSTGSASRKA
jgi:hypothetical protein